MGKTKTVWIVVVALLGLLVIGAAVLILRALREEEQVVTPYPAPPGMPEAYVVIANALAADMTAVSAAGNSASTCESQTRDELVGALTAEMLSKIDSKIRDLEALSSESLSEQHPRLAWIRKEALIHLRKEKAAYLRLETSVGPKPSIGESLWILLHGVSESEADIPLDVELEGSGKVAGPFVSARARAKLRTDLSVLKDGLESSLAERPQLRQEVLAVLRAQLEIRSKRLLLTDDQVQRYSAPSTGDKAILSVKYVERWPQRDPESDWGYLTLTNKRGQILNNCTIQTEMIASDGRLRRNVHFVRRWEPDAALRCSYVGGVSIAESHGEKLGEKTVPVNEMLPGRTLVYPCERIKPLVR